MGESDRIISDIGFTFVAAALNMAFGFVITIVLGRCLGAAELGLYRMSVTINGLALLLAALGVPAAMIKHVAEARGSRETIDTIVSAGVLTSLAAGVIAGAAFFTFSGRVAALMNMPDLAWPLIALAISLPFALVSGALLGALNGLRRMGTYAVATVAQGLFTFVVSFTLIGLGCGVRGAIAGLVIANVLCCALLLFMSRSLFRFRLSGLAGTAKEMLAFGARVLLANGINQVNYQADIVLIGFFTTAASVGYYSVAVILSTFFWLIPQSIQTITYPAIAEYWARGDRQAIQALVDKGIKFSAWLLFPLGLAVTCFAPLIVGAIYGDDFERAVLPLQVLLIGSIVNGAIQRPIGSILYAIGMPDLNLKIFSAAAAGNIVLNVLLIPAAGIGGAAVATAFSYLFTTGCILYCAVRYAGVRLDYGYLARLAIVSLAAYGATFLAGRNYLADAAIAVAYGAVLWQFFLTGGDKTYIYNYISHATAPRG